MDFFGGLLVMFGGIVFPLILIIGMVKPSLFKTPDKTPATRKQIAIFTILASLLCLGIGGAMLPEVESKTENDTKVKAITGEKENVNNATGNKNDATTVKAVKEEKAEKKALPDFGITSDEFVKNYNAVISKADKNMIINSIEDGQSVTYAPMPNNGTMGGVIADNGNLRGLIITIGGSKNNSENLEIMGVVLAAANGVQGSVAKEEISQGVIKIFGNAVENPNEIQKFTTGNAIYVANFMPELGGVMFTIDAVK